MTFPREIVAFERYLDSSLVLVTAVFVIALDDFHADYPVSNNLYSSAVYERNFELLLDVFGNLDAPL